MSRKLPALNAENAPFWQGGERGELLIYHCTPCDRFFHPPAPVCPHCASFEVEPRPVSGKAKVLSFTINHQQWIPNLTVPYVVAIVALADQQGLQFVTNIVGCAPEEVIIDMLVRWGAAGCAASGGRDCRGGRAIRRKFVVSQGLKNHRRRT